jgi:hypothetical protein
MAFAKEVADAELLAEAKNDAIALTPPTEYPVHEAIWLKIATEYEEATGQVVVNPRNLHPQSLVDVDVGWLHSKKLYGDWIKYHKDLRKRPSYLK